MLAPSNLIIHDTAPIVDGASVAETLQRSIELAQHGDMLGYGRYWTAESHGMRAAASCSPSVVCGEAVCRTDSIRVGAGGVLLPNHSALIVSEQFGTLEALHPGRIDLALGRASGGPGSATAAIRPDRTQDINAFEAQIDDLQGYFRNEYHKKVRSVTGYGHEPMLWILGTNPESARLAAKLRMPYAFGAHLHFGALEAAVTEYHEAAGRDSDWTPHLAVSIGVIAADDVETAQYLAGSHRMKVMSRKIHNKRLYLPHPDIARELALNNQEERDSFEQATVGFIVGDRETVQRDLARLQEQTGAHEIIISTPIYDHEARLHSYSVVADALSSESKSACAPTSTAKPGTANDDTA